ncbi:hypothetical protein LIER_22385 [Lithospermum erythrorhizon]|uniref:DUF7812 domain-containing protein n=1 Tax=Lithospermum erythrorhizon TaxID=34254 RepID=A0AAV3QUX9_LITER
MDSVDSCCIFEIILSNLQTPQGIKVLDLKKLYALLVSVTKDLQSSRDWSFDGLEVEIDLGLNVKLGTICSLSNLLFAELSVKFNKFFSRLDDVSTCDEFDEEVDFLLLLLRCCLVLLLILEPLIRLEKGQNLLGLLRKLCSVNIIRGTDTERIVFEKSASHACQMTSDDSKISSLENFDAGVEFLELTTSRLSFISALLEVFIDELMVHDKLLEYFHLIDTAAPRGENQFAPNMGAIGILVEVVCCHFSLSLSDPKSYEDAVNRLFLVNGGQRKHPSRPPEVRLATAASLFLTLINLRAPRYILGHMVPLVSEACSRMMHLGSIHGNHNLLNCILTIYETSVTLYCEQISILQIGSPSSNAGVFCSKEEGKSQHSFESYVPPIRKQKMDDHMRMLDKSSDGILQNIIVGTKSELENSATKYVKECQTIRHMSFPNESTEILSNIILRASDGFGDMKVKSFQPLSLFDVYFISSLLKLMGTSLHLAILCLVRDDSGSCRSLEEIISCKEYDIILGVTSCFEKYSIHLPVLQQLADCMETVSLRHKGSRMMFITFLGLLSLAFNSGVDCLVKGCLLTIMATLNLFASDKDNIEFIDALHQLVDWTSEEMSRSLSLVKLQDSPVDCTSSWVVALKFQKFWTRHSRVVDSLPIDAMGREDRSSQALVVSPFSCGDDNIETEEETEKTTSGEIFANCILQHQKPTSSKLSNFDDLVDFIECEKGKDYSSWLKDRQRLYKSKWKKRKELMWEKKKKSWKQVRGKTVKELMFDIDALNQPSIYHNQPGKSEM